MCPRLYFTSGLARKFTPCIWIAFGSNANIYMHINIHIFKCVYIYACIYDIITCLYIYIYTSIDIYMYVIYMYIYIYIYVHIYNDISRVILYCLHLCIFTYVYKYTALKSNLGIPPSTLNQ